MYFEQVGRNRRKLEQDKVQMVILEVKTMKLITHSRSQVDWYMYEVITKFKCFVMHLKEPMLEFCL